MTFIDRDRNCLALLTGLCAFLFIADLGGRDLWDIDEGMHAAIAQTMLTTGDWITPVFNGEAFLDKPPLFNWMTAVSFQLFGLNEFAARLPAALCGLGSVLLTFLAGRRVYTRTTGLLAAIILATSLMFLVISRLVQYDIPFTFFTTLAMYCYVVTITDNGRRWPVIGLYAATALAVLVKGPLGVVIPGLGIAGHLVLTRQLSQVRRLLDVPGIVVFLLVITPWYLLMERANPGYLRTFIFEQHFVNVIGNAGAAAARHPEPFYYYLPAMLLAMLPWSLALPQSIYFGLKDRGAAANGLHLFLVAWAGGTFLLLSLATSKLSTYILPILPAAAILLGRYWDRLFSQPAGTRRPGLITGIGGLALILVAVAIYAVKEDPWTHWEVQSGILWPDFERFIVVFGGLFSTAFILSMLGRYRFLFGTLASITPFAAFYILWVLAPGVDPYKGAKEIGRELDRLLPESEEIHWHGRIPDSAMFYADRDSVGLDDDGLAEYLAADDRVYVLITRRGRDSGGDLQGDFHILRRIANKAIVSNRPDP